MISIFAGCLANHDHTHSLVRVYTELFGERSSILKRGVWSTICQVGGLFDESILKLLVIVAVSNLDYSVFGPQHVFELCGVVFRCTVRIDYTLLFSW